MVLGPNICFDLCFCDRKDVSQEGLHRKSHRVMLSFYFIGHAIFLFHSIVMEL
jgi:hypothetical protein